MRLRLGLIAFVGWFSMLPIVSGSEPDPAIEIEGANPALLTAELKLFQGNWRLVSHEANEHKKEIGKGGAWKLTVIGNEWKMTIGTDRNSTFKIDPVQSPKHIDRTFRHGDRPTAKKTTWPGIYQFEGDRLTICHATTGDKRPTEFATKRGNGVKVLIFERVHDELPEQPAAKPAETKE